jgi:hypothetical protein
MHKHIFSLIAVTIYGRGAGGSLVTTPTLPDKNLYNGGSEWQNDYQNLPDYYQTYYRG